MSEVPARWGSEPRGRLRTALSWVGPLLTVFVGLILLDFTWLMWPDAFIDFGQQLYIAWQLIEGRVLYEDLVYNYGPLSPYLNALAFSILGVSAMSLFTLNLLVLAGILALVYLILLRIGNPWSAAIGGLSFVVVFAFSQFTAIANYNYAAPYENSLTIGLMLALGCTWFTLRYLDAPRVRELAGAGLCLGLCFLTKPEVFLAGAAALVCGLVCDRLTERERPPAGRAAAVLAASFAAPVVLSVLLLAVVLPLGQAVAGTLGSWPAILASQTPDLLFYRKGMGTDDLSANLAKAGFALGGYTLLFGSLLGLSLLVRGELRRWGSVAGACAGAALVASGQIFARDIAWLEAARPLPVLVLAACVVLAVRFLKRAGSSDDSAGRAHAADTAARLVVSVFALVLLLKMLFFTRFFHYGFALAMPASLIFVTAVQAWVPAWIDRRGGSGLAFAGAACGVLIGIGWEAVKLNRHVLTANPMTTRSTSIGEGGDRFLADRRGMLLNPAVEMLRERAEPGATIAVFPEGAIINYLVRRPNPTPFYNYMPTGMAVFGEDRILQSLVDNPPDWVVLVHKSTSGFGFRYFGTDYGRRIAQWILANYRDVRLFGDPPLRPGTTFGILLMRRKGG